MKTIKLPCFGIVVQYDSFHGGGTITSDLTSPSRTQKKTTKLGAALDGIESLILAQACAGIDIESPAYIEAVETAVEKCMNFYD